jgi:hypothetical protein
MAILLLMEGAEFMAKANGIIRTATYDGPVPIFCKLGYMAATAVPFNQSHLDVQDIEKVLELQEKVIERRRLPLIFASDTVWEGVTQLRRQVTELRDQNIVRDREILERLLRLISLVNYRRFLDYGRSSLM